MRESGHNLWEILPLDAAGPRGSSRPCGVLFHSLTLMATTYAFFFSHSHMHKLFHQHTLWFVFFFLLCVCVCVLFYVLNVLQKLITFPSLKIFLVIFSPPSTSCSVSFLFLNSLLMAIC